MREFDHERMDVYRCALEFVERASVLRAALPPGRSPLADQLDRAAVSIALNIAEGAGEFARKEKARFYRMARRSATECAAILDVIRKLDLGDAQATEEGKVILRKIVAMLVSLGKWTEDSASASPSNQRRA